jgi:hypothetical protein
MGKTFDDFSYEEAMQFEKGKTPVNWVMFWVSIEYLKNPDDPGGLSWMRKIYKHMGITRDNIYSIKLMLAEKGLDNPVLNETITFYDELSANLAAKNITEQDALKIVAVRTLTMLLQVYKDPKEMIEKSEHFFDNSKMIPPEKRKVLEQIRTMSVKEVSELINAAPIVKKLKNVLVSDDVQTKPESAPTLNQEIKPESVVRNINIHINGNVRDSEIIVGDNNKIKRADKNS